MQDGGLLFLLPRPGRRRHTPSSAVCSLSLSRSLLHLSFFYLFGLRCNFMWGYARAAQAEVARNQVN